MKLNNDVVKGNSKNDLEVKQCKITKDLILLRKIAGEETVRMNFLG